MIFILVFLLGFLFGLFTLAVGIKIKKATYKRNIELERQKFNKDIDYLIK